MNQERIQLQAIFRNQNDANLVSINLELLLELKGIFESKVGPCLEYLNMILN